MKVRESGMPEPVVWETFFEPLKILRRLGLSSAISHAIEFGCGYGTFTIPAAEIIGGDVSSLEIDKEMIAYTKQRAKEAKLQNIKIIASDFERSEIFLSDECADYLMLFNILHGEHPEYLLHDAFRLLRPGSQASLIHWNFDPETPRGPPMEMRPKPDTLQKIVADAGFTVSEKIDLPPYHYGFVFEKPR